MYHSLLLYYFSYPTALKLLVGYQWWYVKSIEILIIHFCIELSRLDASVSIMLFTLVRWRRTQPAQEHLCIPSAFQMQPANYGSKYWSFMELQGSAINIRFWIGTFNERYTSFSSLFNGNCNFSINCYSSWNYFRNVWLLSLLWQKVPND